MELDEADRTFIASWIPDNAVVAQFIALVAYIEPEDGTMCWQSYIQSDEPATSTIGLLRMAELKFLGVHGAYWDFPDFDED